MSGSPIERKDGFAAAIDESAPNHVISCFSKPVRASLRLPLAAQLLPIGEPLGDFALEAALDRLVEFFAAQPPPPINLARESGGGLRGVRQAPPPTLPP